MTPERESRLPPCSMTPFEAKELIKRVEAHMAESPDFKESDIVALEEVVEVWKIIQALRAGGSWLGSVLIKWGSIATAIAVLWMYLKGGSK